MLTAARLREVLHYDPATGVWTWLKTLNPRGARGSRAGSVRRDGRRRIRVDGTQYLEHRLAVLYMTGEWPVGDVDHKNVVPGANQWANLRPATGSQKCANTRRRRNNKSGFKGVTWVGSRRKWRAEITPNGKNDFLGYFDTPEAAHAAYVAAAEKHFGEFARAQ